MLRACRIVLGVQRAVMSVCEKKSVKGAKRSFMSLNKIVFGIEKGYEYKKNSVMSVENTVLSVENCVRSVEKSVMSVE